MRQFHVHCSHHFIFQSNCLAAEIQLYCSRSSKAVESLNMVTSYTFTSPSNNIQQHSWWFSTCQCHAPQAHSQPQLSLHVGLMVTKLNKSIEFSNPCQSPKFRQIAAHSTLVSFLTVLTFRQNFCRANRSVALAAALAHGWLVDSALRTCSQHLVAHAHHTAVDGAGDAVEHLHVELPWQQSG